MGATISCADFSSVSLGELLQDALLKNHKGGKLVAVKELGFCIDTESPDFYNHMRRGHSGFRRDRTFVQKLSKQDARSQTLDKYGVRSGDIFVGTMNRRT